MKPPPLLNALSTHECHHKQKNETSEKKDYDTECALSPTSELSVACAFTIDLRKLRRQAFQHYQQRELYVFSSSVFPYKRYLSYTESPSARRVAVFFEQQCERTAATAVHRMLVEC